MHSDSDNFEVVIPAYNSASTISRAISSAWKAGAARVIVIDDGSEDDTVIAAQQAAAEVYTQPNSGAASARRRGVGHCRSNMLILLDSDDELIPEGVTQSIQEAMRHHSWSAVSGRTVGVRQDGSETHYAHWPRGVDTRRLIQAGYAPGPPVSYLWRTDIIREVYSEVSVGVWPRYAEDYEMLIRASLRGPLIYHDKFSARYQLSGGKSTKRTLNSVECSEAIRQHYSSLLGITYRPKTKRQMAATAIIRELKSTSGFLARSRLLGWGVCNSPSVFAQFAANRVRRGIRGGRR